MSDIEFLAIKEFEGKLVTAKGSLLNVGGILCTLDAPTGKDMYIARAGFTGEGSGGTSRVKIELQINGTPLETALLLLNPNSGQPSPTFKFTNIGYKVAAGGTIKLQAITVSQTEVEGFIECWVEDSGVSPQV